MSVRRTSLVAGALLALALPSAAAAATTPTPPTPTSPTPAPPAATSPVTVAVSGEPTSVPRPASFLGLALEYQSIPQWVNDYGASPAVNPLLVGLIRDLVPQGNPIIRVGGLSGDRTWWPTPGVAKPFGTTSSLSPTWTTTMGALTKALDARLLLGLNLEADNSQLIVNEARQLVTRLGASNIDDLEVGNEPDLYRITPWYRLEDGQPMSWFLKVGTPVFSRGPGWGPAEFTSEVRGLERVLPRLHIGGPDAVSTTWLKSFSSLAAAGGRIGLLDSHEYPLGACQHDPASEHYPSIPHLLALSASRQVLLGAQRYVALAHRDGFPFRIDEMGSVTCNGYRSVSDTFASALWVTDALFSAARGGVDGVNLHTFPKNPNGLFDFSFAGGRWSMAVHPIYYGALMFARADPPGARLLRLSSTGTIDVRKWATISSSHKLRMLLINVGPATTARVTAPSGYGAEPGSVQRLLAPTVASTTGVTIGGRSFGPTSTGLGKPIPTTVRPSHGAYAVSLPATSETLITVDPNSSTPTKSSSAR